MKSFPLIWRAFLIFSSLSLSCLIKFACPNDIHWSASKFISPMAKKKLYVPIQFSYLKCFSSLFLQISVFHHQFTVCHIRKVHIVRYDNKSLVKFVSELKK